MADWEALSKERKELQESGDLPCWFTTHGWQMFKDKFRYKAVGYRDTSERIAKQLAQHAPKESFPLWKDDSMTWEKAFFELLWSGKLAPSSPVLSNTGTDRGQSVSCSGQFTGDSVDDFYSNYRETALLSKEGFGTSAYLGSVRCRGTAFDNGNGTASGAIDVVESFVQTASKVSQGAARRGAWAGYIEVDHGDFYEVAEFLKNNPDDCNIGWLFPDSVIEALQVGDEEALDRWMEVNYVKCLTGKGYIWKPDAAMRNTTQAIRNSGVKINQSNLCVAPETQILTRGGYHEIGKLEGLTVEVWNGEEWSETKVMKTATDANLITVSTSNGSSLDCTKEHTFYVQNTYGQEAEKRNAGELCVGDKLIKFDLPVVEGEETLDRAYESGFYTGDGCLSKGTQLIYLYHEKRKLVGEFGPEVYWCDDPKRERMVGRTKGLLQKFEVPDCTYSVESRLSWLSGLLDADGCVHRNGSNEAYTLSSNNPDFLHEVHLMLQTLGVSSKVRLMEGEGERRLPLNDGTGGSGSFHCKATYRLLISSVASQRLKSLGLNTKRLTLEVREPQRSAERFITVEGVEDYGRVSDTYCFTEPKRNMGMFNGILAGNCIEIALPNDEEYTFTCVISSANLAMLDSFTESSIGEMMVFLDCVAQDFIVKGKGTAGMEKAIKFTEDFRALGLGTLGLHTYFLDKGVVFESFEGYMLNKKIYKRLQSESEFASRWMATVLGEPKWCKGLGVRNATFNAIAPNTTSALIAGGVSQGIEPIYKLVYTQGTAAGEMLRINPWLLKVLATKDGINKDEILDRILENKGSIQGMSEFTEEEQLLGRTAFEMDQLSLARMASARQEYLDQGQSFNLFFSSDESEEYISEVLQWCILDERLLGVYYLRMESDIKASKGECIACD